jgi:hypothetical protein
MSSVLYPSTSFPNPNKLKKGELYGITHQVRGGVGANERLNKRKGIFLGVTGYAFEDPVTKKIFRIDDNGGAGWTAGALPTKQHEEWFDSQINLTKTIYEEMGGKRSKKTRKSRSKSKSKSNARKTRSKRY